MFKSLINFYIPSSPSTVQKDKSEIDNIYKRRRWSIILTTTLGYSMYYICRLSFNVMKKPIIDEGLFTESQIGIIGSALFFTYAVGKFINGFLTDRANIRRFMATGILISAIINLILGFYHAFYAFIILWGLNGWFQSMGATPCAVALTRWYSYKERGTYWGFWSTSHNLGESLTFILTAFVVSVAGWRLGFEAAGIIGIIASMLILRFLYESPEVEGLPTIEVYKNIPVDSAKEPKSISSLQFGLLKNPVIWILALSSSLIYVARYSINSWGIFFLQTQKGYTAVEASSIISVSSVSAIVGTFLSGLISDKFFNGRRNVPVLIFGIINAVSLFIFLFNPANRPWIDIASMIFFGLSIGVQVCFLAGLMAIDFAPKKAAGAVLGIVGIASYVGAGIQDIVSGYLIEHNKTIVNGSAVYQFFPSSIFWIGASTLSFILAITLWNAKAYKN
ncbi:MAG: MFS transporter [Ignavibacteriaceae bacterium]|nr:MFS transporter [Ignavibacteriaceae bacterium]